MTQPRPRAAYRHNDLKENDLACWMKLRSWGSLILGKPRQVLHLHTFTTSPSSATPGLMHPNGQSPRIAQRFPQLSLPRDPRRKQPPQVAQFRGGAISIVWS